MDREVWALPSQLRQVWGPSCAQSVMLGCCVCPVSPVAPWVRASSCAPCQNCWELPVPVPSRPLLPSLEAEHTRAVQNSFVPMDRTASLRYLQGSVSKRGTGWSLQRSLGFSGSLWSPRPACHCPRGMCCCSLESELSCDLGKRERLQLNWPDAYTLLRILDLVFGKLLDASIVSKGLARWPASHKNRWSRRHSDQTKTSPWNSASSVSGSISITAITSKGKPSPGVIPQMPKCRTTKELTAAMDTAWRSHSCCL